jgi:hypothetical protein
VEEVVMMRRYALVVVACLAGTALCTRAGGAGPPAEPQLTRGSYYWRGAREQSPGALECGAPAATDAIVSCDRWPDATDLRWFARDAIRLSGARTPQAKALAVWRWVRRFKVHTDGNPPTEKLLTRYGRIDDPIKILNVYGAHYCGGLARTAEMVWRAYGGRADRVHVGSHSMVDLYYRDADGVTRPHLFDVNFGGYMYSHDRSRLMTLDEYCFDYYGGKTAWIHKYHAPWSTHRMELSFRSGERLERIWGNWGKPYQDHMDPKRDTRRTPLFERGPYRTRTYGNGRWTYTVDTSAADWAKGLVGPPSGMAPGRLQPAAAGAAGAAVWHFRTPYIVSDAEVRMKLVRRRAADRIRLLLSVDGGRTFKPVWVCPPEVLGEKEVTAQICPKFEVKITTDPPAGFHSPFGRYAYWLKLELVAASRPADCRVERITFLTTVQQNFYALPQLQPGRNRIAVRARIRPGAALKVTYVWDDPLGKGRRNVTVVEQAPFRYEILAAGGRWEDVVCRSLTVEAVPATGGGNRTVEKEKPSEVRALPPMRPVAETRGRRGWWQRSDPKKLPPVGRLIRDLDDPARRGAALKGLQELRDPAAFEAVRKVAYADPDPLHQDVAIVTLFQTDRRRAKPVLLDILEHPEKVTWTGRPIKKGPQNAGQHWAYTAVVIGVCAKEAGWSEAVPGLLKVLDSPHTRKHVWHAIMRVFASIGDRRVAGAVRRGLEKGSYAAAYAALAAAHIQDREAIPAIRRVLASRDPVYRQYAAIALGRLGDRASAAVFRQMLQDREDESLRAAGAEALGDLGDAVAIGALADALKREPFAWVRDTIQQALKKLGAV